MSYLWFSSLGFCFPGATWEGVKCSDGIFLWEWVWHELVVVSLTIYQVLNSRVGKGDAQGVVQRMAERHQGRKQGLATIFLFFFSQQVFLLLCSGFCPWSGFRDHILGSMGGSCGLYKMSLFLFSFFFFSLFFFKADAFVDATQSSSFLPGWFNYIQKFVIRMFGKTDNENAM